MKKVLVTVLSMIIGGAGGFFGAMYIDSLGGSLMDLFIFVAAIGVASYLQIIIHEGGHLIFGLLTGYRFVSFRIGSFMIYRQKGQIKFGKYSLAGTGGQCLLSSPDIIDGKMPYVLYNLGGIIMNLVVSLLCALILFAFKPGMLLSCFCVGMIAIGILIAITNGLPIPMGEVDNDGRNAMNMGKSPEALRSLWLQLKINEYMTEGIRLKDMPEEWFVMPSEEAMANGMVASIGVFHCNRLMDEGDFQKAGQKIEELLAMKTGMIGIYKSLLTLDLVYCELLGERRKEILDRMQQKDMVPLMKAMKNFPAVLRTQYAYAVLEEKDMQKAEKIKKSFEKMKNSYPYPQEIEGEWSLIKNVDSMRNSNE